MFDKVDDETSLRDWFVKNVRDSSEIGVVTLAWFHDGRRKSIKRGFDGWLFDTFFPHWVPKFLLFSVVIVQWIIAIVLFEDQLKMYRGGFCPRKADWRTQLLSFAVGSIYLTKMHLKMLDKRVNKIKLRPLFREDRWFVIGDRFMDSVYEPLVYLFNLWLVFITFDDLGIILNALALEFVLQMDDQVKALYLNVYGSEEKQMRKFMFQAEKTSHMSKKMYNFIADTLLPFMTFVCWACVVYGVFYLPMCNPDSDYGKNHYGKSYGKSYHGKTYTKRDYSKADYAKFNKVINDYYDKNYDDVGLLKSGVKGPMTKEFKKMVLLSIL